MLGLQVEGEGYRLAYRVAADNLRIGMSVVADSCNPIELTRREWEGVAQSEGAAFVNIEISCSDKSEHRRRVESRAGELSGAQLPTWDDVVAREYHPWTEPRITVDTAGCSPEASYAQLRAGVDQADSE